MVREGRGSWEGRDTRGEGRERELGREGHTW